MRSQIADLNDAELAERLAGAGPTDRAEAWELLVDALGPAEASRRWLAAFAATDASET